MRATVRFAVDTPKPPVAPSPPPLVEDEDYVMRAQIALTEFTLRYWKYGFYAIGVVLVVALGWEGWQRWRHSAAQEQYGAIADIDFRMPQIDQMATYGLAPKDDPSDTVRTANLEEGARRYQKVAESASGSARTMAWLKAEDAWTRAGKVDEARAAAAHAAEAGGSDAVAFAADTAAVRSLIDQGKADEAEATLRAMSARYSGFFAETSLMRLASLQLDGGKADAAAATYGEIETRFPTSHDLVALGELAARLGKPAPKPPAPPVAPDAAAPAADEAAPEAK